MPKTSYLDVPDSDRSHITTLDCVYTPDGSERPKMTTMKYLIGVVHLVDGDSKLPVRAKLAEPRERRYEVSIVSFGHLGTMLGHPRKSCPDELSPPGDNKPSIRFTEVDSFSTHTSEPIENPQSLDCETKIKWLREYMWSFSIVDNGGIDDGAAHMGLSCLTDNDYFKRTKDGVSLSYTPSKVPGSPFLTPGEPPLFQDAFRKYAECAREL